MAIAHDANGSSGPISLGSSQTTFNWSHTVGATASDIWVAVTWNTSNNGQAISGITVGSSSMSPVIQGAANEYGYAVALYHLFSPPTGSQTITVTFNKTNSGAEVYGASASFTGSSTTALDNGTGASNTSTTTSVSLSLTINNANAWIIDATAVREGGTAPTPNSPQVTAYVDSGTFNSGALGMSYNGPLSAGSQSDGWSDSAAQAWTLVAASIQPAPPPTNFPGMANPTGNLIRKVSMIGY